MTSTKWVNYAGKFALSATDADIGYDRIEFRVTQVAPVKDTFPIVYMDDVSLVKEQPLVTTCTCPNGWLATHTNVDGGVTVDGTCKRVVCQPVSVPPYPPDGTPIGTWGFTWRDAILAWGTKENGGAVSVYR